MNKKFTVIGGDLRSVKLAGFLAQDGNEVNVLGFKDVAFETGIKESLNIKDAIEKADVIVGPIPCSSDNETINSPFWSEKIHINEIFKVMNKNQLFAAGRISEKISQMAKVYNVYFVDLLEREEMAVLNAIPTAEGAIQIAMEEMPITLHNSMALVLGFGRIGKVLARILNAMGAEVFVEARKYSDIAWIRSYGYKPVLLSELAEVTPLMDVIFNTIPYQVLDMEILKTVNPECLILDLASKPGGIDIESAKQLGRKTVWALSLPGKVAPVTAAKYIKDTIYNLIDELGV